MVGKSSCVRFTWLLLALSCLLVTGCGFKSTGGSALMPGAGGATPMAVAVGTLHGTVTVSPVCPVETPDGACRPKPLANRQVQIKGTDGKLLTITTDQQGQFSIQLHPGRYQVEVRFVGYPMHQRVPFTEVSIVANQTTEINIPLDTGIR